MPIEAETRATPPVHFMGVAFARLTQPEVIAEIRRRAGLAEFSYIVTPNVDHVVKLWPRRPDAHTGSFRAAYEGAALRICDSRILQRLGRLAGLRMPVIPGSDLTRYLVHHVFRTGDRIAIIGGKNHTVTVLKALFPGPDYIQYQPPMGVLDDESAMQDIVRFVTGARPNVTLFAIGAPQSEIAANACRNADGATGIGLCVGASVDFLTGDQKRAPAWMQKAGLEWLHRLASNPARLWRRYLVEGPRIFWLFLRSGGGRTCAPIGR